MKRAVFDESREQRGDEERPKFRTDYRCKAHGCPNAGSMSGDVCFYHSVAAPENWSRVTQDIRENFDEMRNWGQISPDLQAKRRADSQRKFGQTGRKPTGLQGASFKGIA